MPAAADPNLSKIYTINPFTNCPTWERRELTREQKLEEAARETIKVLELSANPYYWRIAVGLRETLGEPAAPIPAEPTEVEKRRAILEAGWYQTNSGWHRNTTLGSILNSGYDLQSAYAETMEEQAKAKARV